MTEPFVGDDGLDGRGFLDDFQSLRRGNGPVGEHYSSGVQLSEHPIGCNQPSHKVSLEFMPLPRSDVNGMKKWSNTDTEFLGGQI